jgi:hypothetical protein
MCDIFCFFHGSYIIWLIMGHTRNPKISKAVDWSLTDFMFFFRT